MEQWSGKKSLKKDESLGSFHRSYASLYFLFHGVTNFEDLIVKPKNCTPFWKQRGISPLFEWCRFHGRFISVTTSEKSVQSFNSEGVSACLRWEQHKIDTVYGFLGCCGKSLITWTSATLSILRDVKDEILAYIHHSFKGTRKDFRLSETSVSHVETLLRYSNT